MIAACLALVQPVAHAQASEYELKAAFLLNFVKFVEWPAGSFHDEGSLTIGVVGRDPFGAALATIEGKTVKSRTVRVARFPDIGSIGACDLLFIPSTERHSAASILAAVRSRKVLVVGEYPELAEQGSAIAFFQEDRKLRFSVNVDTAAANGFKFNSQLLKLARIVQTKEARQPAPAPRRESAPLESRPQPASQPATRGKERP